MRWASSPPAGRITSSVRTVNAATRKCHWTEPENMERANKNQYDKQGGTGRNAEGWGRRLKSTKGWELVNEKINT